MAVNSPVTDTQTGTVPAQAPGSLGSPTTTNTAAPVSALPNMTNPSAIMQTNTFAPPSAVGGPGVTTSSTVPTNGPMNVADPSSIQSNGINPTQSQGQTNSNSLMGDLQATYGQGTGTALSQAISGLGTVNSSAVQSTIANTDLAANKEYGNIQAQEAAGGVTPNSSTAALASGDFYSTVNSGLQQTIGQQELNQQNTLINTLQNTGAAHGPDMSTWDNVMNGITQAGQIAGAVGGAVMGL